MPAVRDQRIVPHDAVRRAVQINAVIGAKRDQIVADDAVGMLVPREPVYRASVLASCRRRQTTGRSVALLVPRNDHAQNTTLRVNTVPRLAPLAKAPYDTSLPPSLTKSAIRLSSIVQPFAATRSIGVTGAPVRLGMGVDQRRMLDPAVIGKLPVLAVDLDLRVEVLDAQVVDHGMRGRADDMETVVAGAVVRAPAFEHEVFEPASNGAATFSRLGQFGLHRDRAQTSRRAR